MSEDPDYKAARRAVMVTQNKIDAVEQKLQKLPFRRTEARTEEEAQEEREVMRRTLAQNRQEWEDELEGYRQELAEMDDRIRKLVRLTASEREGLRPVPCPHAARPPSASCARRGP